MLGQIKILQDFDWAGAEQSFKRALFLSPSSADTYDLYGRMCAALERYDEAMAMGERARQLDPLAHRSDLATILLRAGRFEQALQEATRAVEFDPNYDRAHATLGWAYMKNGHPEQGIAELERAVALSPRNASWLAQLGQAYALVGRSQEARDILHSLDKRSGDLHVAPYHRAYIHVGLGEADAALNWLEAAYDERGGAVYGIKGSFLFLPLRRHPRFAALLRKMNMPEPADQRTASE